MTPSLRPPMPFRAVIATVAASLASCASYAFVAAEDFAYPSVGTGLSIAGNANGGSGWSGAWQGNANILYHATIDVTYAGYPLDTATPSGSLYSNTSNYRSVYRDLAKTVSGEVWFSYVFRKGGTGSGGLLINATATHATGSPSDWYILVDTDGNLNVNVKGTYKDLGMMTNAVEYLILGRVVTGSNGKFDLWVNPNLNEVFDLQSFLALVPPTYSYTGTATLDPISSLGLAAYRSTGSSSVMRIDSLRISDGEGTPTVAFQEVTGVSSTPGGDDDPPVEGEVTLQPGFIPFNSNRRWLTTPIVRLQDGRLAIPSDANGVVFSTEAMSAWVNRVQVLNDELRAAHPGSTPTGAATLFETSSGTWVMAWRDPRFPDALEDYWDTTTKEPVASATGKVWVTYSLDKGTTWALPQMVMDKPGGYSPKEILETRQGTLIMPMQYHARSPGRNVLTIVRSVDQGLNWSVIPQEIDIGGAGAHDGALEPTIVELRDGRLWILFRTSKGLLGQTFSSDDGLTWSTPTLTAISASSSPPYIGRLSDGRLLLLWNMEKPASGSYPIRGDNTYYSEEYASWWRQELVLALSADEGATWSTPVLVARHEKPAGRVSYPYFFETLDRRVLVFANQGKVEADATEVVRMSFDDYRRLHFSPSELAVDAISGPAGDANGDGVANLLHYALGLSPWESAAGPMLALENQQLSLSFLRRRAPSDLTYVAEVSNDLINWRSSSEDITEEATALDAIFESVRVFAAEPVGSRQFLRLRVIRAEP